MKLFTYESLQDIHVVIATSRLTQCNDGEANYTAIGALAASKNMIANGTIYSLITLLLFIFLLVIE